jgi:uroporphyrinogen-III decarboxylase
MLKDTMSSRERLLAVFRYQEPDHIPLLLHPFGFVPWWTDAWSDDQIVQAQAFLDFGLDAWLSVSPPMPFHPDVRVSQRTETIPGERWPCAVKEYDTPAGVYRQEVFITDDWTTDEWPQHKGGAPTVNLLDDYNTVRYRRCPIQDESDLEKLKYLYRPLPDDRIPAFRERVSAMAREARRLGVVLKADASAGADAAMWLCGTTHLLDMAIDKPELFEGLLDIIHAREKRSVEILVDTEVDLIKRRGYYEGTTFWSPTIYRKSFLPRFKELTDIVHQGGKLMGHTMSVGYLPLLKELAEVGYDMHFLLDPLHPGGAPVDLAAVKAAWRGRIAILGAINQPITLERGSDQDVREEVFRVVRDLGAGGGLGLCPVEAIHNFTPRRSLEALIAAWKDVRAS